VHLLVKITETIVVHRMENVYEEKLHLHYRNKSVRVVQQNQLHLLVTPALGGCGSPLNRGLGEPQSRCECI
jgi:hypothetical protein